MIHLLYVFIDSSQWYDIVVHDMFALTIVVNELYKLSRVKQDLMFTAGYFPVKWLSHCTLPVLCACSNLSLVIYDYQSKMKKILVKKPTENFEGWSMWSSPVISMGVRDPPRPLWSTPMTITHRTERITSRISEQSSRNIVINFRLNYRNRKAWTSQNRYNIDI